MSSPFLSNGDVRYARCTNKAMSMPKTCRLLLNEQQIQLAEAWNECGWCKRLWVPSQVFQDSSFDETVSQLPRTYEQKKLAFEEEA